nr:alanyl-tRNA editing protein [Anaerolineae bacterium]
MTRQLYYTDSYARECKTTIVAVNRSNNGVVLDQTVFYPGGGGQPADRGALIINDEPVALKRIDRADGMLYHILDSPVLPEVDSRVVARIDWEYRYALMRTHTAMHILCGVVWRDYSASVTGGNMDPLKGRMDFEFETMCQELVMEIEDSINQEVANARPVKIDILPREEAFQIPDLIRTKINLLPKGISQIRTVEIVGLDLQADGGTHVRNTSEVGRLKVVDYKSKGRINKRIYLEVIP